MMAPIILGGVISKRKPGKELIFLSSSAFLILLASLLKLIPGEMFSLKLDIILYAYLGLGFTISMLYRKHLLKGE